MTSPTDSPRFLAEWLDDLRFGFLAAIVIRDLRRLDRLRGKPFVNKKLESDAAKRRFLVMLVDKQQVLERMPPSALKSVEELLRRLIHQPQDPPIPDGLLEDGRLLVLERQTRSEQPTILPALTLSQLILKTRLPLRKILPLSSRRTGLPCKEPDHLGIAEDALLQIRRPTIRTTARLAAVEVLLGSLGNQWFTGVLRNTLYHYCFCWPLLVNETEAGDVMAYSLPIAVDMNWDGKEDSRILRSETLFGCCSDICDTVMPTWVPWIKNLDQAAQIGRRLWRTRWADTPIISTNDEFFRNAWGGSVEFDLTYVHLLTKDLKEVEPRHGSAVPYFSQVVLARMLGKTPFLPSAITGKYEPVSEDDHSLEMRFVPSHGIESKVDYALGSQFFERIVLGGEFSASKLGGLVQARRNFSPTEVHIASTLEELTDLVQYEGWRVHSSIRLPNLRLRANESPPAYSGISSLVREIISSPITKESGAIKYLKVQASSFDVALDLEKLRSLNPTISWAAIQLDEGETPYGLLRNLWHLIDPPQDWLEQAFPQVKDLSVVASLIARAMNTFVPPDDSAPGYRAPDMLVILGDHESLDPTVRKILELLGQADCLVASPLLNKNSLRIVFVPRSRGATNTPRSLDSLSDIQKKLIVYMSVFRWGSAPPAMDLYLRWVAYQLNLPMTSVLDALFSLQNRNPPLIVRAPDEVGLVPEALAWGRDNPTQFQNSRERAMAHLVAALAISPLMTGAPFSRLDFERSVLPVNEYEAAWHVKTAHSLIKDYPVDDLTLFLKAVHEHLHFLHDFTSLPGESIASLDKLYRKVFPQLDSMGALNGTTQSSSGMVVLIGENGKRIRLKGEYRKGAFGSVYTGNLEGDEKDAVAVKIFHGNSRTMTSRQALDRELSSLLVLTKTYTPTLIDWGNFSDGRTFIASALTRQDNLQERVWQAGVLKGRPILKEEALKLFRQMLEVLVVAHSEDILHLDIKPANILIQPNGVDYWLADFGLSCAISHDVPFHSFGTPGFRAPEQVQSPAGQRLSSRADLYGLGRTMKALLSGVQPTEDSSPLSPPKHLHDSGLWKLLDWMTAKDPADRVGGAADCLWVLDDHIKTGSFSVPRLPGKGLSSDVNEILAQLHDPVWRSVFEEGAQKVLLNARTFNTGDLLLKEGEPSFHMLVLLAGSVQIERDNKVLGIENREGTFLGEISTLTGQTRTASVRAHSKCICLAFSAAEFDDLLGTHPFMASRLLRQMARRILRESDNHSSE